MKNLLIHTCVDASDEHRPATIVHVDSVALMCPLEAEDPSAASEEVASILVEMEANLISREHAT
eukprot:CAMPEP_0205936084 /NCGR_PEP_ID=MMETSP1325-20131115/40669_1 /ASSEMBLY_ACC=CAM_ASM_000708 /TAXON_ID=236786 /ORGANISM="Florenciella sp., Strain RCC1007" /LENGTH=63 /DNA_ID=CAMNT_0053306215 /DNA_START=55 /DNA_END=246 /DNA_ORIENTATION=-